MWEKAQKAAVTSVNLSKNQFTQLPNKWVMGLQVNLIVRVGIDGLGQIVLKECHLGLMWSVRTHLVCSSTGRMFVKFACVELCFVALWLFVFSTAFQAFPVKFMPGFVLLKKPKNFYIALFSTLKPTDRAFVACDSKWVTVAVYGALLNIPGCT